MRRRLLECVLVCLFILAIGNTLRSQENTRPNVIVFYTDDHGYADIGCQGVFQDLATPNVDRLAASGVRAVHGYSTAPQCVPSRGGLMVGKFQSRFGLETNGSSLAGFDQQTTIAERLRDVGYVTAQFGKWHLGPTSAIPTHGFQHVFSQNANRPFDANIGLDGQDRPMGELADTMYHVDGCSRAAASIIERYSKQPFFLYIAYRAPHVPLDAPAKYLARFPGEMPERRRQALAMISAVDDGVGLVLDTLRQHELLEKTLIFYIGDNGAPLKINKADEPGGGPGWDGSLNDPLNGEKGMLAEGGMHVPFVIAWPGTIPGGQAYQSPVSALDVAATVAEQAQLPIKPGELDGVNLVPYLRGELTEPPHQALMWRWSAQSAIRAGDWKLLRGGEREYLYNLEQDLEEKHNLLSAHPDIAQRLREHLQAWSDELTPPGVNIEPMAATWNQYFDFYLEGKTVPMQQGKSADSQTPSDLDTRNTRADALQGWIARNGELQVVGGALSLSVLASKNSKGAFLARAQLNVPGPLTARLRIRSNKAGEGSITWRTTEQKDFVPANRIPFSLEGSSDSQMLNVPLPVTGSLVHLRLHLPAGEILIQQFDLLDANQSIVTLWR